MSYDYSVETLKADEFVIDGFIKIGMTVLAAPPGAGKTSAFVPMACHAAHLCGGDSQLKPVLRRKVSYVTEDPGQVEKILYGMRKHGYIIATDAEFKEWFEIIPAVRTSPEKLAQFVKQQRLAKTVTMPAGFNHYEVQPLIVLDTSNATIDLDSENDNSEAGRAIALIKQEMDRSAIWLVAHTSKVASKADVTQMSARGASAFEGDANAVAYLVNDKDIPDARFLVLGKRRFEASFTEVKFTSEAYFESIQTPWGLPQQVWYRYGVPVIAEDGERLDMKNQAHRAASIEHRENLRGKVLAALFDAQKEGKWLNTSDILRVTGGKKSLLLETLEAMVSTGTVQMKGGAKNSLIYSLT